MNADVDEPGCLTLGARHETWGAFFVHHRSGCVYVLAL